LSDRGLAAAVKRSAGLCFSGLQEGKAVIAALRDASDNGRKSKNGLKLLSLLIDLQGLL
jgi:hypothetical protein